MNILVYRCFQKKKYLSKNFIKECAQMKKKEGRVIFEMKEVNWFYVGHLILCGLIRVMMQR